MELWFRKVVLHPLEKASINGVVHTITFEFIEYCPSIMKTILITTATALVALTSAQAVVNDVGVTNGEMSRSLRGEVDGPKVLSDGKDTKEWFGLGRWGWQFLEKKLMLRLRVGNASMW